MPYTKRPFNFTGTLPNQILNDLELADDNFDILAQAFVNNDPASEVVKNADTVDGFHASQTPAPNVIVPLDASGILDLSATYVKSSVYTFRRVDLTNATGDYMLQVGEEAYISFNNVTSVPLRIQTDVNMLYEIILQQRVNINASSVYVYLNPNNTTYASSFSIVSYFWNSKGESGWVSYTATNNAFQIYNQTPHLYMILETTRRTLKAFLNYEGGDNAIGFGILASKWHSNLAAWTSLGTFTFPYTTSGYILVRRLA